MAILQLLRACSILALIVSLPVSAHAIGAAGDTEWPAGASVETRLSLTASIGDNGQPKIEGTLTVINPGDAAITMQKPTNRLVFAFLVCDSLGNPVAPTFRGKSDPAFDTRLLDPKAKFTHAFADLDFVTGSALWLRSETRPTLPRDRDLSPCRPQRPRFHHSGNLGADS
jgi:hypothetical protein